MSKGIRERRTKGKGNGRNEIIKIRMETETTETEKINTIKTWFLVFFKIKLTRL